MNYIYQEKERGAPVFILLHGTGGSESDLLPIANRLNPDYNILAIRGNVKENGMNRYFKRHGEGHYDWEDLAFRAEELYHFIKEKATTYDFSLADTVLVGFSNGSNIATEMLLQYPQAFKRAALFAPMYPKDLDTVHDFSDLKVFLSLGDADPIVSPAENERITALFKDRGAHVTTARVPRHNITEEMLAQAAQWLTK